MSNPNTLCKPWQPGQSGNPKGRPKNRVPDQLMEALKLKSKKEIRAGLTAEEIDNWDNYLLNAASDELTILAADVKIPIYARATARAIIIDMKNGKTATIDKLRDRLFGKQAQRVELTGKDGAELYPARRLTPEEAAALQKSLDEEY